MNAVRKIVASVPCGVRVPGFVVLALDARKGRQFFDLYKSDTADLADDAKPCVSLLLRQLPEFVIGVLQAEIIARRGGALK